MPTYKVVYGKRTEFLSAKNEAQLKNALMRSHSYPIEE